MSARKGNSKIGELIKYNPLYPSGQWGLGMILARRLVAFLPIPRKMTRIKIYVMYAISVWLSSAFSELNKIYNLPISNINPNLVISHTINDLNILLSYTLSIVPRNNGNESWIGNMRDGFDHIVNTLLPNLAGVYEESVHVSPDDIIDKDFVPMKIIAIMNEITYELETTGINTLRRNPYHVLDQYPKMVKNASTTFVQAVSGLKRPVGDGLAEAVFSESDIKSLDNRVLKISEDI